jgi:hypothetical protein
MVKRSSHGIARHADAGRPTTEANRDKEAANEIYLDIETGYYVFVGARGRTHVFTSEGVHHTSFRTTRLNRSNRVLTGKWENINRDNLPKGLK